uniref:Saposin B-type domain-containing protein n=1 Tax=Alexandrium monilatum TaxID=311494 RepID=A0A7S4QZW0_9DINO
MVAQPRRPQGLGLLLAVGALAPALAGPVDQEYQAWAAKVYKSDEKESVQRGDALACSFCQIVAAAVGKQYKLNKERPREERYSEDDTRDVLLELCTTTAPRIAQPMGGYVKDAEMICRRVVNEQASDMMDAVSLGEDMSLFCKEQKICPLDMDGMLKLAEKMAEIQAEEKKKKKEQEL